MNQLSPKAEMQTIIKKLLDGQHMLEAYESFKLYQRTFGSDNFTKQWEALISSNGPLVSLICLNCSDDVIDHFLSDQRYTNLEVVRLSDEDSWQDVIDYMCSTESKYITFLEDHYIYAPNKISDMVWAIENLPNVSVMITPRNHIDAAHTLLAHPDPAYWDALKATSFSGKQFLAYCFKQNQNLYGTLSTCLVTAESIRTIPWEIPDSSFHCLNNLSILSQLIRYGVIHFMPSPLASKIAEPYRNEDALTASYTTLIPDGCAAPVSPASKPVPSVLKEITFFYTDKGEYYNLLPISAEAEKRGYTCTFTTDIRQHAEIGVYCQHICYPENSKFSLILLHDLAQGHNRWPNLWEQERWDKFDIGILPGKAWADRWSQCACFYYANPRYGSYELGYPKSDSISDGSVKARADELRQTFNLKYDFSVLYAPSWENDEKEDDFVRALASLKVNLLIKQAHWSDSFPHIIQNIKDMRNMHENKYDNVYYIEPEESILTALALCDMVVSDESSVMAEAVMFQKPSVAVIDWLIPDTIPSRFSDVPMDYVLKCKKVELREYVEKLSTHSADFDSILQKGSSLFSNVGNCCKEIIDAIEYYTNQKADCTFLDRKLSSKYTICSMWN